MSVLDCSAGSQCFFISVFVVVELDSASLGGNLYCRTRVAARRFVHAYRVGRRIFAQQVRVAKSRLLWLPCVPSRSCVVLVLSLHLLWGISMVGLERFSPPCRAMVRFPIRSTESRGNMAGKHNRPCLAEFA